MFNTILFAAMLCMFSASSTAWTCRGGPAFYKVAFTNLLTNKRFGKTIPQGGLVFSPLSGVSHSNRQSFLTVRGFASKTIEEIAETGNNEPFIAHARRLRRGGEGVLQVRAAEGPTMPGLTTELKIKVNCENSFITVVGMIAPSPDWIVQINNMNMVNPRTGRFIRKVSGDLIAYDAGTDDGREFTSPSDPSLDMPSNPHKNIAPLVEDESDRFGGRIVGRYHIERML